MQYRGLNLIFIILIYFIRIFQTNTSEFYQSANEQRISNTVPYN